MWRRIRIIVLLFILAFVALNTWFDRLYSTDWDIPLRVAVYPINGDGGEETERFIAQRSFDDHSALERFFSEQAAQYALNLDTPVTFASAQPLRDAPPALEPGSNPLQIAWWSLRTRLWAWRAPQAGPAPDVKLFVLYHDPQRTSVLPHSIGLQKGLFAIVHAFADRSMLGSNDVVIAHELLHTLGATDKYDLGTNQPLHPEGFAEPGLDPLYPQNSAELMGGRIPLSPSQSETPESLNEAVIGPATAHEIGWRSR
ncbi:MAG TPA: hypothetical protein VHK24_08720 [Steroidobacter sp.]|jgi:hypothetical protein|nr:hypothetical protein [Steroidobacter sp.]